MDKFTMELTWHNCKTCPPEEDYNHWLVYTNGRDVGSCSYHKSFGFPISDDMLHDFWWADLSRAVHQSAEFKEVIK